MKRYLNVRTLAIAAVALVAVIWLFPGSVRYLPLLLLAACPLSMIFMHGREGHRGHEITATTREQFGEYVCPMHSEVRSTFPGDCPICGMELETVTRASSRHG